MPTNDDQILGLFSKQRSGAGDDSILSLFTTREKAADRKAEDTFQRPTFRRVSGVDPSIQDRELQLSSQMAHDPALASWLRQEKEKQVYRDSLKPVTAESLAAMETLPAAGPSMRAPESGDDLRIVDFDRGALKTAWDSFRAMDTQIKISDEWSDYMTGDQTYEEAKRNVQALRKDIPASVQAGLRPEGWGADAWLSDAANFVPTMIRGGAGYAAGGLIGGATAGGLTLLATAATPIPGDEALAGPAAKAGFKWGARIGGGVAMGRMEAGLMFDELQPFIEEEGIDPSLVTAISASVGGLNAAVELWGFEKLLGAAGLDGEQITRKGISKAIRRMLDDGTLKGVLKKYGRRVAGGTAPQVLDESVQELNTMLGQNLLSALESEKNIPKHTLEEMALRVKETAEATIRGGGLLAAGMAGPRTVIDGMRVVGDARARQKKAVMDQLVQVGIVRPEEYESAGMKEIEIAGEEELQQPELNWMSIAMSASPDVDPGFAGPDQRSMRPRIPGKPVADVLSRSTDTGSTPEGYQVDQQIPFGVVPLPGRNLQPGYVPTDETMAARRAIDRDPETQIKTEEALRTPPDDPRSANWRAGWTGDAAKKGEKAEDPLEDLTDEQLTWQLFNGDLQGDDAARAEAILERRDMDSAETSVTLPMHEGKTKPKVEAKPIAQGNPAPKMVEKENPTPKKIQQKEQKKPLSATQNQKSEQNKGKPRAKKTGPVKTTKQKKRMSAPTAMRWSEIKRGEFQPRTREADPGTVARVADDYESGTLDLAAAPLVVWKDEKGQHHVLAGNSRHKGVEEGMKRRGDTDAELPVIVFQGTREEARVFADTENEMRSQQTAFESARAYRRRIDEGAPRRDVEKEARQRLQKLASDVIPLTYISPKGKTAGALEQMPDDRDVLRMAKWIGNTRARYAELTDSHENELYDFILPRINKTISSEAQLLHLLGKTDLGGMMFDPSEPLNILKATQLSDTELAIQEKMQAIDEEVSDLQDDLTKLRAVIERANEEVRQLEGTKRERLAETGMTLQQLKEALDSRWRPERDRTEARIRELQAEKLDLQGKSNSAMPETGSLFGDGVDVDLKQRRAAKRKNRVKPQPENATKAIIRVSRAVKKILGRIPPGLRVIHDPTREEDAWFENITVAGKRFPRIVLNAANLADYEQIQEKLDHELAHYAYQDAAVAKEIQGILDALDPDTRLRIWDAVDGLYDADLADEEIAVRAVEEVRRIVREKEAAYSALRRAVAALQKLLRKILRVETTGERADRILTRALAQFMERKDLGGTGLRASRGGRQADSDGERRFRVLQRQAAEIWGDEEDLAAIEEDLFDDRVREFNDAAGLQEIVDAAADSPQAVTETYFRKRDGMIGKVRAMHMRLRDEIADAVGEKKYGAKSRHADLLILLNVDLREQSLDELGRYKPFVKPWQWAAIVESKQLPPKLQRIADFIHDYNRIQGMRAYAAEVIDGWHEHYIARLWRVKENERVFFTMNRLGLRTNRSMRRTLSSVAEGWANLAPGDLGVTEGKPSLTLAMPSATGAMLVASEEIENVIASKFLVETLTGMGLITDGRTEDGRALARDWDNRVKQSRIKHGKMTARIEMGRRIGALPATFWAHPDIVRQVNAIVGKSGLADSPVFKAAQRVNFALKHLVLFWSLFHHQAFLRSFFWGTPGLTGSRQLLREEAAKAGIDLDTKGWQGIAGWKMGMNAYKAFTPDVKLLSEMGLTIGVTRDWRDAALTLRGDSAPARWWNKTVEVQQEYLFEKLGNGLKVRGALLELYHLRHKFRKDLLAGTVTDRQLAGIAATIMNEDFGGLHLERMGRSRTTQDIMRFLLLAPDWTESNFLTLKKAITKGGPEGWAYRAMWRRTAARVFVSTAVSQILLNALAMAADDDEDDWEKLIPQAWGDWRKAFGLEEKTMLDGLNRWRKLDWLGALDLTRLMESVKPGSTKVKGEAHRYYFSLLGHFRDPIKWILNPTEGVKHKGAWLPQRVVEGFTGTDWRGYQFTTVPELFDSGEATKWGPGTAVNVMPSPDWTLPSFLFYTLQQSLPIQGQQAWAFAAGETDAFMALSKAAGLMTSRRREERKSRKKRGSGRSGREGR